jgi:hypothetical protein
MILFWRKIFLYFSVFGLSTFVDGPHKKKTMDRQLTDIVLR